MPLDMSNQPELALPFESTRALLAKWREREAGKIALIDLDQDGKSISWGELSIEADKIAKFLSDRGIRPGDKIAVLSDEYIEKLIIWMGIWRYGAAICPLNVEMNEVHLVEILEGIDPALTLWHSDLDGAKLTSGLKTPSIMFEKWKGDGQHPEEFFTVLESLPDGAGTDIESENGAEDLSCIFCTSGTTSSQRASSTIICPIG